MKDKKHSWFPRTGAFTLSSATRCLINEANANLLIVFIGTPLTAWHCKVVPDKDVRVTKHYLTVPRLSIIPTRTT